MSEQLAFIRKKGGGGGRYKETSLWTNSAPTSDFASQNVTLSDNISNYKYLKFKYRNTKSGSIDASVICLVSDFKQMADTTTGILLSLDSQVTYPYARRVYYASDTTVAFKGVSQIAGTSSNNGYSIPLEILGLNELDHGHRMTETTLWTNPNPSSSYSNGTVTLSDDIDNYDYIKFTYKPWTTSSQIMSSLYPLSDVKLSVSGNSTNHSVMSMICNLSDNSNFARRVYYASDTSITFNASYQINASNSSANTNIPQQIIGCKLS